LDPRERVAREAARLLYTGTSEEYKHAKERAASSLGLDAMPSNFEVALELDILADELEGEERKSLLARMRERALEVMRIFADLSPRLIGSVWRGTAKRGSDLDIEVYSARSEEVESRLTCSGYVLGESEDVVVNKGVRPTRSRHLTVPLEEFDVEVVIRPPEEMDEAERCEIYGDAKRGLGLPELEKLMKTDPLRKFVPGRRHR
jgi:predicted nucleotidyltransferase